VSSLLTIGLRREQDIVSARQRARQVADLLGFDPLDQARISTAVSEIARNAYTYGGGGNVAFEVTRLEGTCALSIRVSDSGPGIADLENVLSGRYESGTMGSGLLGARRLMDACEIRSGPGQGTEVVLSMRLPGTLPENALARMAAVLAARPPQNPTEELLQQNRELMQLLTALRQRQEEMVKLNNELEDTNRGVVALYAELDEKAESLRRADETKTRFLSNMSHEFRTPLNSIRALTRILLDRTDGDLNEEQEKQMQFINRAAEDLAALVDDLLDIAKIEAGKIDVHPVDFSVDTLFSALRGMFRPLIGGDSVHLVFEDVQGLPSMRTDEGKVSQILRNLISNALRFTERGEVRVTACYLAREKAISFSVIDTGIGIAPQDQERVFEEFIQVTNRLQKRSKGTGLGLPLCRRLASLLGGKLLLQSELQRGSTFTAVIPVSYSPTRDHGDNGHPALPRTQEPIASVDGARSLAVLIIDDEESSRYVLARLLAEHPVQVQEAADGIAGFRRARALRPDLIFLDLSMPLRGGEEVLNDLKSDPITRDIPVVIVSNFHPGLGEARELRGAAAVVPKATLSADLVKGILELASADPKPSGAHV
jgi:signal transduction histidine kinase